MNFKKKWGVDRSKAVQGVWITVDADGAKIKVARFRNSSYIEVHGKKIKDAKVKYKTNFLTDVQIKRCEMEAFVETVLLGWEGIEDEAGLPTPYSFESAIKYLTDYPEFEELVVRASMEIDNFREDLAEEIEKNSEVSSPGN